MDTYKYIKDLIESNKAAFRCPEREHIDMLAEMIEHIYPSYGEVVRRRKAHFDAYTKPKKGFCVRVDSLSRYNVDIGHSSIEWYASHGRTIIDVKDLYEEIHIRDFGEITTKVADVYALLF